MAGLPAQCSCAAFAVVNSSRSNLYFLLKAEVCMARFLIFLLGVVQIVSSALSAQTGTAPDTPEPGSVEAIAAATGDKRFLSPWVSSLPSASARGG